MNRDIQTLVSLYKGFNVRNMEAVLAAMDPEVAWANGLEGGHVHGHQGVREYWTRQWATIDSHATPVRFTVTDDGSIAVNVEVIAYDLDGKLLFDENAVHIFQLKDGLVTRFDIQA